MNANTRYKYRRAEDKMWFYAPVERREDVPKWADIVVEYNVLDNKNMDDRRKDLWCERFGAEDAPSHKHSPTSWDWSQTPYMVCTPTGASHWWFKNEKQAEHFYSALTGAKQLWYAGQWVRNCL